jgi:hypothetical protein
MDHSPEGTRCYSDGPLVMYDCTIDQEIRFAMVIANFEYRLNDSLS